MRQSALAINLGRSRTAVKTAARDGKPNAADPSPSAKTPGIAPGVLETVI